MYSSLDTSSLLLDDVLTFVSILFKGSLEKCQKRKLPDKNRGQKKLKKIFKKKCFKLLDADRTDKSATELSLPKTMQ